MSGAAGCRGVGRRREGGPLGPHKGRLGASGGACAWMDRGGAGGRLGALRALPERCTQYPGAGGATTQAQKSRLVAAWRLGRAGLVDYRLMPYVYPYIMSGCVIDWVNIVIKHCSATFPGATFG